MHKVYSNLKQFRGEKMKGSTHTQTRFSKAKEAFHFLSIQ